MKRLHMYEQEIRLKSKLNHFIYYYVVRFWRCETNIELYFQCRFNSFILPNLIVNGAHFTGASLRRQLYLELRSE